MRMLHLRSERSRMPKDGLFIDKLRELGEYDDLPFDPEMPVDALVDLLGQYDVLLTIWGNFSIPPELAKKPGRMKYICNVSGSLRSWIPIEIIESEIQVSNWGDAQANCVAEAAMMLLLSALKDMPSHVLNMHAGINRTPGCVGGTLWNARVAIYGLGVIGMRFVEMLRPFGSKMTVYDPYVKTLPEGCERVNSLDELFADADILVVHAAWCAETEGSITARHLAMLPDNAVIVNTARGELFDQDALMKEFESGRLRGGIDVLNKDIFEPDNPARQWRNWVYTSHMAGNENWPPLKEGDMERMYWIALDNLSRFKNGEPLKFTMDTVRYLRST